MQPVALGLIFGRNILMLPMIFGRIIRVKKAELNRSLSGSPSMETHPSRVKLTENMVFNRYPPAPKTNGPRVHCTRIESNLAIYEAGFRLDLIVGFVAKTVITNHGEVHHRRFKPASAIN
jgi:hypothetical protein